MPTYDRSSLQKKDKLEFYQAPHLETTGRLIHAFSTREGGVSGPPFDSLNLSFKAGDRETNVRENRELLTRTFGLSSHVLQTANQVHGDTVLTIDSSSPEDPSRTCGDAMVTNRPGIAIGVLTADCVPILLFDPNHEAVAVLHAGWKGTARDLSGKTVRTMMDRFDTDPQALLAVVGPSIGSCCYEVDHAVWVAFSRHHDRWSRWATQVSDERWMMSLSRANIDLLVESGIRPKNIAIFEICTCCQGDLFYSHRRDDGQTGRQIAFIMLK